MTTKTIHRNSVVAKMTTDHMAELIRNYIAKARTGDLDPRSSFLLGRDIPLLLLELDDREEWSLGDALRRELHEAHLKVF